jgi:hypothetical protein
VWLCHKCFLAVTLSPLVIDSERQTMDRQSPSPTCHLTVTLITVSKLFRLGIFTVCSHLDNMAVMLAM